MSESNFADLNRTYRVTPIQQPELGAAFDRAYLSRLPLQPPLIIQLDCWDAEGELTIPYDELPFLVCHLSLLTAAGDDASMASPSLGSGPVSGELVAMLYGTLVASAAEMDDMAGAPGVYFVFADVSVRYQGSFRLQASVYRITGGQPLDTCVTEPFEVVGGSEYVAPPLTELTQHFDAQGVVRFGVPRAEW
ncbi:hypothetical protein Q5752_004381 [Cryptotrichosporon argae]